MTDLTNLTAVERLKAESDYLRGNIVEKLDDGKDCFDKDTVTLLKHHGMYQQDDRDRRGSRGPEGQKADRVYGMMVRSKIPGGKLTREQFLAELDLADELADGTLRITTRQDLQLHGVPKRNLRRVIRRISEVQLTTLGACGDVGRNVMCCPAIHRQDPVHEQMQEMADRLSAMLMPRTTAYREIWLDDTQPGQRQCCQGNCADQRVEPLYGEAYLPRKFKLGIGLAGDDCVDVYTNDLGLLAICGDFNIVGYNLLLGGGMGSTPANSNTFPALGQPMAYVAPEQVLDVAAAVIEIFRDFGNRADRKRARLKYLIADWGLEKFKATLEQHYGHPLPEPRPAELFGFDDHIGWHEQGDGLWFYGLFVENGRILDREGLQLKSALREICQTCRPGIRLTAQQNILLTDVVFEHRSRVEQILHRHEIKLDYEISPVRRCSMACVALPTCGMAITESERVLPAVIDQLEIELARLALAEETLTVRMTGCSHGCSRPQIADVGLMGRGVGKYRIYLGGRILGNRLGFVYKDQVPLEQIVPTLLPVLVCFSQRREARESLGDFCHRLGAEELAAAAE